MSRLDKYMNEAEENFVPTPEMFDFFAERTHRHLTNVKVCLERMQEIYPALHAQLAERITTHDQTKFQAEEHIAYVHLTWFHKMRNEGKAYKYPSPEVEAAVQNATRHHIASNRHHPEYHGDLNDMTKVDLIEMVCDWEAMSIELGGNTKEWADTNVGTKWKFNPENTKLIYMFIEDLA
jgi:hypothetical protein